jgi:tetratricopeptide (TPR) repeat protein
MNDLARAYQKAGKPDLALPLLEETLKLNKAKFGDDHPDTLLTMNNLAGAYWTADRIDKSIPLFEKLVQLCEAKWQRDHPELVTYIANLGVNYLAAGRVEEAIPLLEEIYEGRKSYPESNTIAIPLVTAYLKTGRAAELTNAGKILAEIRKSLPPESPQLTSKLALLGNDLLEARAHKQAEPILRECMAIREKIMPDHWLLFNTKSMLGGALLGQEKYAEAEPLLIAGYEGLVQREATIPSQGKIRLTQALERLVSLYTALEKPDDVNKWQAELERQMGKTPRQQPNSENASLPDDHQSADQAAQDDGK